MSEVLSDQFVLVGYVTKPHGVHGAMKVFPVYDDLERLFSLDTVYLGNSEKKTQKYDVEWIRTQIVKKKEIILLKLFNVVGSQDAERMRKQSVFALVTDLPLSEESIFLKELIGMKVQTTENELIGIVDRYLDLPTYLVYVVKRVDGSEVMIPAVPAFIEKEDVENRMITISTIEGLID